MVLERLEGYSLPASSSVQLLATSWASASTTNGTGSPATYALAGMGAFFSVVSKVPITAIVIVFEMTTDFNLVLPLMIGSVTAYLVCRASSWVALWPDLELSGIHLQKKLLCKDFGRVDSKDVMQPRSKLECR